MTYGTQPIYIYKNMDVAEIIVETAQEMLREDENRRTLTVNVQFNNFTTLVHKFLLLPDGFIRYNSSRLRFTKVNFSMMLNEMMKRHFDKYSKGVSQVYLSIHNSKERVFHTRLPYRIPRPICQTDMYFYDMYMTGDNIVSCMNLLFRYMYRFKRNHKHVSTNTETCMNVETI